MHFSDVDLLSAEQQIQLIEKPFSRSLGRDTLQKLRHLLKRDYQRHAISTMQFIDLSQRVNVLSQHS